MLLTNVAWRFGVAVAAVANGTASATTGAAVNKARLVGADR
jgi:hypothetical protein